MVERDQRGPVAALTAIFLGLFLQLCVSTWYVVEVIVGPRKACDAKPCKHVPPHWLANGRFALWAALMIAFGVTAWCGAGWVMRTRPARWTAVAAGVTGVLLVVVAVLAVQYPPTYRPK